MGKAPAFIPSFGRRKGHKLRARSSHLMETLLPTLLIHLPEGEIQPLSLFSYKHTALWFEIGFGGGEHLVQQALTHRDISFIGCEPYINGIASLLAPVAEHKLTNIRLFDGDARLLLEKLPDESIDRLFILFPDPWPKTRHHKRRIISAPSLELFYRKLRQGGLLRLATDHYEYGAWMLEQCLAHGKFSWTAKTHKDWQVQPEDWVQTRYQTRGLAGLNPLFLDFIK